VSPVNEIPAIGDIDLKLPSGSIVHLSEQQLDTGQEERRARDGRVQARSVCFFQSRRQPRAIW
jgi:hypothetical protein